MSVGIEIRVKSEFSFNRSGFRFKELMARGGARVRQYSIFRLWSSSRRL